jgi:predicted TIM-barrel fold metal-dependent hydrolase
LARLNITEELKKFRLIDAHAHLGVAPNTLYYKSDNDRVIEVQKKFNVEVSVCSPIIGIFGDLDAQMEVVTEGQKRYGKSIYWQLVYLPRLPQKSLDTIEKNRKRINFAGIKIFSPGSDLALDSKLYYPLWEYATANDIIVAAHTWSPYTENPKQYLANPLLLAGPLKDFPGLKIILVHSGGKANFYDEVIDFIANYEHVYMDFSGDCFHPPVFRKVINKAGKTKSLFGTDMPMMDVRYHIANVLVADISDSDKADIFYNNSARLFQFS